MMIKPIQIRWYYSLCIPLISLVSCIEEIAVAIPTKAAILVVDARINDQKAPQTILLSSTFPLDSIPKPEGGAQVNLMDNQGMVFPFLENKPGQYTSTTVQLTQGLNYQLQIKTEDGVTYQSTWESLPKPATINSLKAVKRQKDNGETGVAILLANSTSTTETAHFRYEFEETFKVIAPEFSPFEWDTVDYDFFCEDDDGWEATIKARQENAKTCFATKNSTALLLATTTMSANKGLQDYELRFLQQDNFAITHRYSILAKQYHHNAQAHSFFKTLQDFSDPQLIFSNIQTGKLEGNISAEGTIAPVLGYFELSNYAEKRLFFSFNDIFPGAALPPYIINCEPLNKPSLYPEGFHATEIDGKIVLDGNANSPLLDGILAGLIGFVGINENYQQTLANGEQDRAPYLVKSLGCVDCRVYGKNKAPEFWIE